LQVVEDHRSAFPAPTNHGENKENQSLVIAWQVLTAQHNFMHIEHHRFGVHGAVQRFQGQHKIEFFGSKRTNYTYISIELWQFSILFDLKYFFSVSYFMPME